MDAISLIMISHFIFADVVSPVEQGREKCRNAENQAETEILII